METKIVRNMTENRIIFSMSREESSVSYCEKMLCNNILPGLLPLQICYEDDEKYYQYDIGEKQTLEYYFEKKKMTYAEMTYIMRGILNQVLAGDEYLLKKDDYLVNEQSIFIDAESQTVYLCYVAGYGYDLREQLHEFITYLMDRIDYNDQKAVNITYRMYQTSNNEGCTLTELLTQLDSSNLPGMEQQSVIQQPVMQPNIGIEIKPVDIAMPKPSGIPVKPVVTPVIQKNTTKKEKPEVNNQKAYIYLAISVVASIGLLCAGIAVGVLNNEVGNKLDPTKFGAACVLLLVVNIYLAMKLLQRDSKEDGKKEKDSKKGIATVPQGMPLMGHEEYTQALQNTAEQFRLCAIDQKDYRDICITSYPFIVGKSLGQADAVLSNPNVSRMHARFTKSQGKIYVEDLGSTNGTWLNNARLESKKTYEIQKGNTIRFADAEFLAM